MGRGRGKGRWKSNREKLTFPSRKFRRTFVLQSRAFRLAIFFEFISSPLLALDLNARLNLRPRFPTPSNRCLVTYFTRVRAWAFVSLFSPRDYHSRVSKEVRKESTGQVFSQDLLSRHRALIGQSRFHPAVQVTGGIWIYHSGQSYFKPLWRPRWEWKKCNLKTSSPSAHFSFPAHDSKIRFIGVLQRLPTSSREGRFRRVITPTNLLVLRIGWPILFRKWIYLRNPAELEPSDIQDCYNSFIIHRYRKQQQQQHLGPDNFIIFPRNSNDMFQLTCSIQTIRIVFNNSFWSISSLRIHFGIRYSIHSIRGDSFETEKRVNDSRQCTQFLLPKGIG